MYERVPVSGVRCKVEVAPQFARDILAQCVCRVVGNRMARMLDLGAAQARITLNWQDYVRFRGFYEPWPRGFDVDAVQVDDRIQAIQWPLQA